MAKSDGQLGLEFLEVAAEGVHVALQEIPVVGGLIKWRDRTVTPRQYKPLPFLVCYDISDDRRRDRTARLLESRVDRINKSVFEGRASLHDYQSLAKAMRELARPEDSVHIFSLCKSCRDRTVRIGHALPLHTQDWYIV